jgi:hypothetical protein
MHVWRMWAVAGQALRIRVIYLCITMGAASFLEQTCRQDGVVCSVTALYRGLLCLLRHLRAFRGGTCLLLSSRLIQNRECAVAFGYGMPHPNSTMGQMCNGFETHIYIDSRDCFVVDMLELRVDCYTSKFADKHHENHGPYTYIGYTRIWST